MLFRHISGQGGTGEDPKINKNMKQAKKSKREDGQLEKTCFFQRRRFFVKKRRAKRLEDYRCFIENQR